MQNNNCHSPIPNSSNSRSLALSASRIFSASRWSISLLSSFALSFSLWASRVLVAALLEGLGAYPELMFGLGWFEYRLGPGPGLGRSLVRSVESVSV